MSGMTLLGKRLVKCCEMPLRFSRTNKVRFRPRNDLNLCRTNVISININLNIITGHILLQAWLLWLVCQRMILIDNPHTHRHSKQYRAQLVVRVFNLSCIRHCLRRLLLLRPMLASVDAIHLARVTTPMTHTLLRQTLQIHLDDDIPMPTIMDRPAIIRKDTCLLRWLQERIHHRPQA